ncbi:hypothetical protein Tco_1411097 [Tanacetum coccineum]
MVKSWLVQDQTVLGKDYSNLLIADSLLKTIWFINAPCYGNEALASPKANGICCDAEEMRCKFKIESEISGQMTYFVASPTLDSAKSCVMQGASCTQRKVSMLSFGRISPNSFLSSILLVVVIIVTVVIVVVILIVVVVVIVGVVIVVAIFGIVVVVDVCERCWWLPPESGVLKQ